MIARRIIVINGIEYEVVFEPVSVSVLHEGKQILMESYTSVAIDVVENNRQTLEDYIKGMRP